MTERDQERKVIRDVIHGYISLSEFDLKIIDTENFQRLKRIRQTGAFSVYPCANHTRFEHSLGVMHLGQQVIQNIRNSLDRELDDRILDTVKSACLLHDIGHAPFSHIGESFLNKDEIIEKIKEGLDSREIRNNLILEQAAPHELCSCAISIDKYGDTLLERDIDLDLFCRLIIGEKYDEGEKNLENCVINILNSDADVDKLDYILRDSFMSGAKLISLDIDRLISAYTVKDDVLAFSGKALSTITNLIYGRDLLYNWVYNHHITVYTDFLYKRLIEYLIEKYNRKEEFFSYDAIATDLIDDHHVISFIREYIEDDSFAFHIYDQIFNRKYYKSLWKNGFDFDATVSDPTVQDYFTVLVGKYKGRLQEFETKIIDKNPEFSVNDFYIALAQFKPFNPIAGRSIYIILKDEKRRFQELFQENIHKEPKPELPYIFIRNSTVRQQFLEKLNQKNLI